MTLSARFDPMKPDAIQSLLKGSRYVFLKNPENLTEKQDATLTRLCNYRLKTARAYLIKLALQDIYFATTLVQSPSRNLKSGTTGQFAVRSSKSRKLPEPLKTIGMES